MKNNFFTVSYKKLQKGFFLIPFCFFALLGINVNAQQSILGLTSLGGVVNSGTMFKIDTTVGTNYFNLHNFSTASSINPEGSLIKASNGTIYGMTHAGGSTAGDSGAIFSYNLATLSYSADYFFVKATGFHPTGALTDVNGKLYGMTHDGGANGKGVIFKYDPNTTNYTDIYDFTLATGANPYGSLTYYKGLLYGMTNLGGAKDSGVIFSIDTATYTYTDKVDLGYKTGGLPFGTIFISPAGTMLALTSAGGAHDSGSVLLYDPVGNTVTDKHDFGKLSGGIPDGQLIWGGSKLYGLTSFGGTHDSGTIFSLDPVTYSYTKLYDFTKATGTIPRGSLMLAANGDIYGMTSGGGNNKDGILFRMDTTTHTFKKLIDFAGSSNGKTPFFTQLLDACIPPSLTQDATNAKACAGTDTSFTVNVSVLPGGTATYQWEVNTGSGFSNVANTGVYSGATAATLKIHGVTLGMNGYIFKCVTHAGCIDSTVTRNDTLKVSGFNLSVTGNVIGGNTICAGATDTLMANITNGTSPFTYSWNNGKTTSTDLITAGGTYTVIAKDKSGCVDTGKATVIVNSAPVITITSSPANDTVCKGSSVTLSGNGAMSYSWNNGITDGTPFTPAKTTEYVVTGTASNGCKGMDSVKVVVDTVMVTINGNKIGGFNICGSGNDTLTATETSGIGKFTYLWSNASTSNPIIVNSAATYSVAVTDAKGCKGNASATVNVKANPTITITSNPANDTVCKGSPITLSGNGAVSYSWNKGVTNGTPFSPVTSGKYIVTGTDANGCQGKDSVQVGVRTLPVITITSNPANDTVCKGSSVTLSGNGAVSYTWNNGITNGTPFTPASTSKYIVSGTDTKGCVGKDSVTVMVDTVMVVLHGNTVGNLNICGGGNDTITATTSSSIGKLTYAWSTTSTTDSIIVHGAGTFSVAVTDAKGCKGNGSATVSVKPNPTITITSNPTNDTVCKGSNITLSGNGGVSYTWNKGVSNATPFAPAASGTYIVTGTDANGCKGVDSVHVGVRALPKTTLTGTSPITAGSSDVLTAGGAVTYVWSPSGKTTDTIIVHPTTSTTYTVNGTDKFGCSDTATFVVNTLVGIDNLSSGNSMSLFPNPVRNTMYLSFTMNSSSLSAVIKVIDITGKEVMNVNTTITNGKNVPVDISSLPQGLYFVQVVTDKSTQVVKFIKQ